MIYRLGELFCGAGGIACGAKMAKYNNSKLDHCWATDYDKKACLTYTRNICPDNPESVICEDIHTLDMTILQPVDALAFGFPCNDFSTIGNRSGTNGKYGRLYTYCVAAVKMFNPLFFFAENVGGIKSSNRGEDYKHILNEFEECGYTLYPHLYRFEEYGIPQKRHRIIIVGIRNDQNAVYHIPDTDPYKDVDISAKTAISNIPDWAANNEPVILSDIIKKRLEYIKQGQNIHQADIPKEYQSGTGKFSQCYKRLEADKPAYTVIANSSGESAMYHWEENRALTNREKARLQTFPDEYEFIGGIRSVRKQIGMAVPPKGAKIIFEQILKDMVKN